MVKTGYDTEDKIMEKVTLPTAGAVHVKDTTFAVSYTHLDVYKRQD